MKRSLTTLAVAGALVVSATQASAQSGSAVVNTKTSLYLAGGNSFSPPAAGGELGIAPIAINLDPGTGRELRVSATGSSTFCPGATCMSSSPDGPSIGGTNLNPSGMISGIQSSSSGFLAGLFLGPALPGAPAASYDFASIEFTSFAPMLGQIFFIGDGFTSSMIQQLFYVPDGATRFYFGIADGGGFGGDPGYYDDNVGEYSAKYSITAGTVVPEPSTYALMLAGLAAVGLVARRRRA